MKKEISIYIHIPFCHSKCYYCDFNSHTDKNEYIEKYVEYLKKEIDLYSDILKKHTLNTVFFGGGTPSWIDGKYIKDILTHLFEKTNVSPDVEITIESNPKTLNLNKLKTYKEVNINRISLGVQTLNDELLKSIGRTHSSADFYDTFKSVKQSGFKSINVDIMFNLPGQSMNDLMDTLKIIVDLNIPHISFYSLKIEEGTPFHDMYESGSISLSEEELEREMYHSAIKFLQENGYSQYEISNFAKEGYECIHNLTYWKLGSYLGFGVSAHSNIDSFRYGNVERLDEYFKYIDDGKLPIDKETKEFIDIETEIAEYLILGLRLNEGIDKDEFKNRYEIDIEDAFKGNLNRFKNQGFISETEERIVLTEKGLDLCNLIFMEILP